MKHNLFLLLLLCSNNFSCSNYKSAKGLNPNENLQVIDYTYKDFNIIKDKIEYSSNTIQIAYYKDYCLYIIQTYLTSVNENENGVIDVEMDGKNQLGEKLFYVFNKNETKGHLFFQDQKKWDYISFEAFNKRYSMNFHDYNLYNLNTDKLDKIDKISNNKYIEKYTRTKGDNEPDSIYCTFDKNLNNLKFSFNKKIDLERDAKFYKIELLFNTKKKSSNNNQRITQTFNKAIIVDTNQILSVFKEVENRIKINNN